MSSVNRADLLALEESSESRESMLADGLVAYAKSGDLHKHGYNVVFWGQPRPPFRCVVEYVPRRTWDREWGYPRLTADTYARQAQIHVALGLGFVPPGAEWHRRDDGQPGLFGAADLLEGGVR